MRILKKAYVYRAETNEKGQGRISRRNTEMTISQRLMKEQILKRSKYVQSPIQQIFINTSSCHILFCVLGIQQKTRQTRALLL